MRRFRPTGRPPPAPALVLHLWPCALWLACPPSDDYAHAVPRRLASLRPSRRARWQHGRACGRRSTPACPALPGRGGTRSGRAGRPLPWATRPAGAETLAPEALHGPLGLGLQAGALAPGHAGRAEPPWPRLLSGLGLVGRLWCPRPCRAREAAAPRLASATSPSLRGRWHALLRRTARWRQSGAVSCSALLCR